MPEHQERFFGCDKPRTDLVPDPYLYDFCNANLPSAKDFYITDIDLVIRNRKGCIMFVEVKRKNSSPSVSQSITYQFMHACIMTADKRGTLKLTDFDLHNWKYYGYHLLQFENTSFEDGKVFFDYVEVDALTLTNIMSFKDHRLKILASSE